MPSISMMPAIAKTVVSKISTIGAPKRKDTSATSKKETVEKNLATKTTGMPPYHEEKKDFHGDLGRGGHGEETTHALPSSEHDAKTPKPLPPIPQKTAKSLPPTPQKTTKPLPTPPQKTPKPLPTPPQKSSAQTPPPLPPRPGAQTTQTPPPLPPRPPKSAPQDGPPATSGGERSRKLSRALGAQIGNMAKRARGLTSSNIPAQKEGTDASSQSEKPEKTRTRSIFTRSKALDNTTGVRKKQVNQAPAGNPDLRALLEAARGSSCSYKDAYAGKLEMIKAALEVLDQKDVRPGKEKEVKNLRKFLNNREQQLTTAMDTDQNIEGKLSSVFGKKKADTDALKADVSNILSGTTFGITANTPHYREDALLTSLLEKVCVFEGKQNANFDLKKIITKNINEKNWEVIDKSFELSGGTVRNTITPASSVLNKNEQGLNRLDERLAAGSTALGQNGKNFFSDYERTDENGNTVLTGSNCHDVMGAKHTKACARTSASFDVAGKIVKLFKGVRHGTVKAYGINPKYMEKMSQGERLQTLEDTVFSTDPSQPVNAEVLKKLKQYCAKEKIDINDKETLATRLATDQKLCKIVRRQANLNAAREIIMTHILTMSPEEYAKLVEDTKKGVPFRHLSIGLVTPGKLAAGAPEDERGLLKEQALAFQDAQDEINSEAYKIILKDPEGGDVLLKKCEMHQFNAGVNIVAMEMAALSETASGWDFANKEYNMPFLKEIGVTDTTTGVVGSKLQEITDKITTLQGEIDELDDDASPEVRADLQANLVTLEVEKAQISQLCQQISDIMKKKDYTTIGTDPYKLPARVAVLCDLLGLNVSFNCKSGKDRTSALDEEIKFLALEMAKYNAVPQYDQPNTEERIQDRIKMVMEMGNFEWQKTLTGFPGYMVAVGMLEQITPPNATEKEKTLIKEIFFGMCGYPVHW